jgi:hypothetical protein
MNHQSRFLSAALLVAPLLLSGCYTQLSSVRDERRSEYAYEDEPVAAVADSTDTTDVQGYAGARDQFYSESYCAPVVVGVGFGWGYPWCYDPPYYGYYYGGWYRPWNGWGYDYPYYSGNNHHYYGSYGVNGRRGFATRTFGPGRSGGAVRSARTSGAASVVGTTARGTYISGGADATRNEHRATRGGRCPHEEWCSNGHRP